MLAFAIAASIIYGAIEAVIIVGAYAKVLDRG
jgi:hypothetical protein